MPKIQTWEPDDGAVTVTDPPNAAVLQLPEVKAHLRVETEADDGLISDLIATAEQTAANTQNVCYLEQGLRWTVESFPGTAGWFYVPRPPLSSVTTIKYIDVNGDQQTLDAGQYLVFPDHFPGRITPAHLVTWPQTRWQPGAVQIDYVAGHDSPLKVSATARHAMKLMIGAWYAFREDIIQGAAVSKLPEPVAALSLLAQDSRAGG